MNTYLLAHEWELELLLRIDDMDQARLRMTYLDDIFRTLESLGLHYDIGPSGPSDFLENWSQRKRKSQYDAIMERLKDEGKLYPCACSRKELSTHLRSEHFSQHCWSKNHPFAAKGQKWRLKYAGESVRILNGQGESEESQLANEVWDFAVRRKNGEPTYQLCSFNDDLHFGISHIVRGEDLRFSSFAQAYLGEVLGENSFRKMRFYHHSLVKYEGKKLSKSQSAPAAKYYLGSRSNKERVLNFMAAELGLKGSFSVLGDLREAYLEGRYS